MPLGSLLMIHDVWLPMYMGTAAQLISSFMVALVPETNLIGPLGDEVVPDATSDSLSDESGRRDGRSSLLASLKSVLDDWAVLRSPRVIILSMTFFINKLARASFRYLLQYASSQFDWTLAKVCTPLLAPTTPISRRKEVETNCHDYTGRVAKLSHGRCEFHSSCCSASNG